VSFQKLFSVLGLCFGGEFGKITGKAERAESASRDCLQQIDYETYPLLKDE
jgi:hypothetical protein